MLTVENKKVVMKWLPFVIIPGSKLAHTWVLWIAISFVFWILSDEGLTLETSFFILPVRWPIYIINCTGTRMLLVRFSKRYRQHSGSWLLVLILNRRLGLYESANDPRTANDPQIGPQMISDRKWSPYWAANDPDQKIGMAWMME